MTTTFLLLIRKTVTLTLQFATRDFLQCGILTSIDTGESGELPFKNIHSKCFPSVAYQALNIQAICKGSGVSVRMRRLV